MAKMDASDTWTARVVGWILGAWIFFHVLSWMWHELTARAF